MAAPVRFSCHPGGQCLPDPNGKYPSLEECQAACASIGLKDLDMIAYEYNPELAVNLAPSARQMVLKRITGVEIAEPDQELALLVLATDELEQMIKSPPLWPYLRHNYTEAEYREALRGAGIVPAFQELIRLGEFPSLSNHQLTEDEILDSSLSSYFLNYGARYGRSLYMYLETLDQPLVLEYAEVTDGNSDLADYLVEPGKFNYHRFLEWLAAPVGQLARLQLSTAATIIRKYPQQRVQLLNRCLATLNSPAIRIPRCFRNYQDLLELLAAVGMTMDREWVLGKCHLDRLTYSTPSEAINKLCIDGTLPAHQRLNLSAELGYNQGRLIPLIEEYNRTPEVQLPNLNVLCEAATYRPEHGVFQRISDEALVEIVQREAAEWGDRVEITDLFAYIGTLSFSRRLYLREELRKLGYTQ